MAGMSEYVKVGSLEVFFLHPFGTLITLRYPVFALAIGNILKPLLSSKARSSIDSRQ